MLVVRMPSSAAVNAAAVVIQRKQRADKSLLHGDTHIIKTAALGAAVFLISAHGSRYKQRDFFGTALKPIIQTKIFFEHFIIYKK
ncbi:MAG: hypothetical protein IKB04_02535 [Clostridia bacterium]|nr:hypothetical protein [Clostridia bacterium]